MPAITQRQFFIPFSKVDKPKRIVWGIAQDEGVDSQDDLLTYESSVDAFGKWAGNIREQHDDTKAVGKAIEVIADPKKRHIVVGAHVSVGAEETWQKVLDGTLGGFSIGGQILEAEYVQDEKLGREIRKVSKYELYELSLVDVPANSACVITAVEKRGKTLVATDVLEEISRTLNASDILTSQKARAAMAKATKRAKVKPVVEFIAKAAKNNEEFVMVKMADITRTNNGGFMFKGDAQISQPMKKDDFDADGYSDPSDEVGDESDPDSVPMDRATAEGHAENMALCHKDMCLALGMDHNEHYDQVTSEDPGDEDEDPPHHDSEVQDSVKSRRLKRQRARARKNKGARAADATPSKLEAEVMGLKTQIADLTKALKGDGNTPRPGDQGENGGGEAGGQLVKNGGEGDKNQLALLKDKHAKLVERRDGFIAKGSRPQDISPEERREREKVGNDLLMVEEQIFTLEGKTAR